LPQQREFGQRKVGADRQPRAVIGFSSRAERKVLAYGPVMANKGGGPQATRASILKARLTEVADHRD
jgi:hypothetical protein